MSAVPNVQLTAEVDEVGRRALEEALNRFPQHVNSILKAAVTHTVNNTLSRIEQAVARPRGALNVTQKRVRARNLKWNMPTDQQPGEGRVLIASKDDKWPGAKDWKGQVGRINLVQFAARQTPSMPGATYQMTPGGGRRQVLHAFIATMKSGHRGVFLRQRFIAGRAPSARLARLRRSFQTGKRLRGGRKRPEKIAELWGPSIPHVAQKSPELQEQLRINATEHLNDRIVSGLNRYLAAGGQEAVVRYRESAGGSDAN